MNIVESLIKKGFEVFGRYYSCYRGFVIDNEDPKGLNRLILNIPTIHRDSKGAIWAWPRNQFSGNNYGINIPVQKGDTVWVEFEHGHPRHPVWSYGHYSKNEKPETFRNHHTYGIKTPKGNIVYINDSETKIFIQTKEGEIILNEGENGGLTIPEKVVDRLNKLESRLNTVQKDLSAHTHISPETGAPTGPALAPGTLTYAPLVDTKVSDIENDKVKH